MAWAMLDRFVFRRDGGAKQFPENETAAGSSTCIGAPFRVSLVVVAPPAISRLYLEWPRGPKPDAGATCHLAAVHRGCLLLRLTSLVRAKAPPPPLEYPDDYFIYKPAAAAADPSSPWSLTRLPTCIKPKPAELSFSNGEDEAAESESESASSESESVSKLVRMMEVTKEMEWAERAQRQHDEEMAALGVEVDGEVVRSSLVIENVDLLCHGEDEFVAGPSLGMCHRCDGTGPPNQWGPQVKSHNTSIKRLDRSGGGGGKVSAELALLHSGAAEWELTRVPVHYKKRDSMDVLCFSPQAVVPFGRRLCWIDYRRGVLLCDVLEKSPTASYTPFPCAVRSTHEHRGVCATNNGCTLKLVDVVVGKRSPGSDADEPWSPFTIDSYTLRTMDDGGVWWEKDASAMTAHELWTLKAPSPFPHKVPMFPLRTGRMRDEPHRPDSRSLSTCHHVL
ncbi:hypothetical protein ACP70R_000348 [Stipagrostis hirtigluma subsp. patula]